MSDFTPPVDDGLHGLVVSTIGSFVRHGLTYLAGLLGAAGALTGDQQTQFIGIGSSLALAGVSFVWAYLQKKHAAKTLAGVVAQVAP